VTSAVHDAFVADLGDVARLWLERYDKDGGNPFQSADEAKVHRDITRALIAEFTEAGAHVLDAGCGTGETLAGLDHLERDGVDIIPDYRDAVTANGLFAEVGDLEALPYLPSAFEAVVCTDVLEHVLDLNAAVRELLRVLRPGGVLIIRVPDSEDLHDYLDAPWRYIHLRRFDEASVILLFTRVFGCEVVKLQLSYAGTTRELHAVVRKP
jgi:SAM-dependent methyltransferase